MTLSLFTPRPDAPTLRSSQRTPVMASCLTLLSCSRALADTVSAEDAAVITDAVITLVTPLVTKLAQTFAVTWPDRAVDADDLAQEALLEIVADLPNLPLTSESAAKVWISSTAHKALWSLRRDATLLARTPTGVDDLLALRSRRPAPVLAALDAASAQLIRLREAGYVWRDIARTFRISIRTARRRYAAAVELAQRIEMDSSDIAA